MTRHLTPAMLDGYLTAALTPEERVMVATHVAECDACRQLAASHTGVGTRVALLRKQLEDADEHPDFETLANHVDGQLDPAARASVDLHVASCEQCDEDVQDLRATWTETSAHEGAAPPAAVMRASTSRITRYTVAAAVLAVVAGGAWYVRRAERLVVPATLVVQKNAPLADRFALVDTIGRVALAADGRVTGLTRLTASDAAAVTDVITTGRLSVSPAIATLRTPAGPLMGVGAPAEAHFSLAGPLATMVESVTPEFTWTAATGATTYRISVFDDRLNLVVESGALTETRWTPRAPLARDHVYSWQVRAETSRGPVLAPGTGSPQARFRVLDAVSAALLESARHQYGSTPLVMGVLYARAGLLDDARRELEALRNANPDSSIAAELLRQIKAARPPS
jgi:anti-sigma factor ChrR (cupin superfamily)